MCAQRGLKSPAHPYTLIRVFVVHMKKAFYPWLSKMRSVMILISLCECAGWSESSLGAHVRRYVFWSCSSCASLIQQTTNWWYFSYFSQKKVFDILCKLSQLETICMKCQILISRNIRKIFWYVVCWKIYSECLALKAKTTLTCKTVKIVASDS